MAEAEALGKSHTKIALEKLRVHLEQHPAALDGVLDRLREGGKKDEAQLVSRFVQNTYPGVPYTVAGGEEGPEVRGWSAAFTVLVGAVLVAAGAAAVSLAQSGAEPRNL